MDHIEEFRGYLYLRHINGLSSSENSVLKSVAKYGWIGFLLIAGSAYGDSLFGIYAGAGSWQQEFSGDITSGITEVNVEDDLMLQEENNNIFYLALEHGVPALPNLRLQHAQIVVSGNSTLTRTIEFNGTVFNLTDDVVTDVDLTQTDLVLYYQILDNVVSLDLGVAARQIDGFFEIATTLEAARAEFEGVMPLLYGKVRADLPLTGLWIGAEVQGLACGGYDRCERQLPLVGRFREAQPTWVFRELRSAHRSHRVLTLSDR